MKFAASVLSLLFINSVAKGDKIRSGPHGAEGFKSDQVEEELEAIEEVVDKLLMQTKNDDVKERYFGLPSSDTCLIDITRLMNTGLDPIETLFDILDPFELAIDTEDFLHNSQLPRDCNADASVHLHLGTLTGLSSNGKVNVNLDGFWENYCDVDHERFKGMRFKGMWEVTKTVNLVVGSSAELTGAACGLNAGAKAKGHIIIPDVTFSARILMSGFWSFYRDGFSAVKIDNSKLHDFRTNFHVVDPDITFLADSPLADFELSRNYVHIIYHALKNTVGDIIEFNLNAMNYELPITIP